MTDRPHNETRALPWTVFPFCDPVVASRHCHCFRRRVVRRSTASRLHAWNYAVRLTGTGERFWQQMSQAPPSAVLLDIRETEGEFEILSRLRLLWRSTPVVVISSAPTIGSVVELAKCGAMAVVAKPPPTAELRQILEGITGTSNEDVQQRGISHEAGL